MIERYAAVVCDWSLEVAPGTRLLVDGTPESKSLATAVAARAWRTGATVSVNLQPDWSAGVGLADEIEGAFDAVCEILELGTRFEADSVSRLRRVRCLWPTDRAAQREGVGTLRQAESVFSRCLLDRSDPIAAWRDVAARNDRAAARLEAASRLSVGGTEIAISGAEWECESGRALLPGAFVKASLTEGMLLFDTGGRELSARLGEVELPGAIALDGAEVTAW